MAARRGLLCSSHPTPLCAAPSWSTHQSLPSALPHAPRSKCPSPYLSGAGPTTVRTSWALTAAQFWELAREAGLLSRHTPLSVIDTLLQQACSQPEAVIQWRRKVMQRKLHLHPGAVLGIGTC